MRSPSPVGHAPAPESAIAFRATSVPLHVVALPSPAGPDGAGAAGPNRILRRASPDTVRTCVPVKACIFRCASDFAQPSVQGFGPPAVTTHWKRLDIDLVWWKEDGK